MSELRTVVGSARARPASGPGAPNAHRDWLDDPLHDTLADAAAAIEDVHDSTRAVAGAIFGHRHASATADATLAEAATHARIAVAAVADIGSAVARGEALVGALARLARQTQRTALNASIEAARVGEDGRAFAAVADALRRLAEEAATAARTAAAEMADARGEATRAATAARRSSEALDEARGPVRTLVGALGGLSEEAGDAAAAVAACTTAIEAARVAARSATAGSAAVPDYLPTQND